MNPSARQTRDRLLNARDIPTIPDVHGRILKLIEDVNYSADEVSGLIEKDPVLSSKVLKLVNSPFYGLYGNVASVKRAIVLMGSNLMKGVILSSSLFDLADRSLPGLWSHSFCVSIVAGSLAVRMNMKTGEEIMTGGLLHDLGKVLIWKQLPDEARKIAEAVTTEGMTATDAEQKIIGITHDEVGTWLSEKWNLPRVIRDIVGHHHHPGRCSAHAREAAAVHFADIVVKGFGVSPGDDPFVPPLDAAGWGNLGIAEGDIEEVLFEAADLIQDNALMISAPPGGGDAAA